MVEIRAKKKHVEQSSRFRKILELKQIKTNFTYQISKSYFDKH